MLMATAASLYSSSPPTIPPAHSSPSSSCPIEIEFRSHSCHNHHHHHHHAVSRPVVGGLTSLFGSPSARYADSTGVEASSSRRSSFSDTCASLDSSEIRSDIFTSSKLRERSPIASFQGPASFGASPSNGSRFNNDRKVAAVPTASRVASPPRQEDLYYLTQESPVSFLTEIPRDDIQTTSPSTPRLTKMSCSSLSEFFCKPLFPENLKKSQTRDILLNAQNQYEVFKDPLVVQAFEIADQAHDGQLRADGSPYLVHCVETAMILAGIGANKVAVAAGLLHDTVDDSFIELTELEERFGLEVTNLVEGVSRLSEFSKLARDNGTAYKSVEADRLHTMMLAMTDVRVVLIKLADRLHNMRTLGALPREKQFRIAKETLEVFVPLASRLGIWSWKAEIEDLCFKHLQFHEHRKLSRKLSEGSREKIIMSAIQKLDASLSANGVEYLDLCGRPKNLYSIHKKMMSKGRKVEEIYDAQGLRIIVSNVEDCYTALELVHQIWECVPGKLKDYISKPKANGYQSLHTVVWGEDGLPLEIQIRTMEMHHQAEFGVAAHWRYKEGDVPHPSFVLEMVEWARCVLTWQNEIMDTKLRISRGEGNIRPPCPFPYHNEACPYMNLSNELIYDKDTPLYVIVVEEHKMMVHELPRNSTVADLLERTAKEESLIPTAGGFLEDSLPKVNHKEVVNIQQRLQMGDLVEMVSCRSKDSLNEYRDQLRRMYNNNYSIQDVNSKSKAAGNTLSEVAVY